MRSEPCLTVHTFRRTGGAHCQLLARPPPCVRWRLRTAHCALEDETPTTSDGRLPVRRCRQPPCSSSSRGGFAIKLMPCRVTSPPAKTSRACAVQGGDAETTWLCQLEKNSGSEESHGGAVSQTLQHIHIVT